MMAVYTLQGPDGRTYEVEGPAGATAEQLGAFIQAQPKDAYPSAAKGTGSTVLDAGNAVGTGYNRAMLRLAGLPVDTVANVLDLGKAAIGAPYMALSGKDAPPWLQPTDRSKVVGSGDYLINKASQTGIGDKALNPVNPDYEGGYLQASGGALSGVMNPSSWPQAANQAGLAMAGALGGKAAYDATGNPALAITANMLPNAGQQMATALTQHAIRGGEQGRLNMQQRVQDLKNAGIDQPTVGLASGNKLIGGIENILQSTPGAINTMAASRERALAGLQGRANEAADLASGNRGSLEAGLSIQKGLNQNFRNQTKATTDQLYDELGNFIPPQTRVNVSNTSRTLSALNEDIPGAPELSKQFKNERIQSIARALQADSGMAPTGSPTSITSPVFGRGAPMRPDMMGRMVPISGAPDPASRTNSMGQSVPVDPVVGQRTTTIQPSLRSAFSGVGVSPEVTPTIPFEALKKTRTLVGGEIADNTLMSDVPRSKWNPLYGALSEDMRGAAAQAGPEATSAFNRANNYNRAVAERTERVAPFADAKTPEQAYRMYAKAAEDNLSTLRAVKKSLPDDARGSAAGTMIERLGKARPGAQDDTGSAWSPETFLTNWNKMTPETRQELMSGFKNAAQAKEAADYVARAAAMMRDSSRMWANPSGTAANTAARGVLTAVPATAAAAATGVLNPAVPLGIGGGLIASRGLAKWLTNPDTVEFAMSKNNMSPERQWASAAAALLANGNK